MKIKEFSLVILLFITVSSFAEDVWVLRETSVKVGAKVLKRAQRGEQLTRIATKGTWSGVKVKVDGRLQRGWVKTADLSTTPIRHSAERSRPITQPATQKPTLKPEWETKELRAAAGPGLHPGNAGAKGAMMLIRMKSIGGTLKRMRDLASQVQPVFAQMISLQSLVAVCGFPPDRHQMIRNSVVTTKPLAMIVYPSDASLKGEPEACLMIPVKDGHRIEPLIAQKVIPQAVAKVDGDYLFIGKSAVVFDRIMQDFGVIRNIPVSDFSGDVQVNVFVPNTKHLIVFEIEEELANAREQARSSKDPEDIADLKMQQLVAGIFLTMLDELTQANFGLSFEKTGLRFSQSLIAAPNSKTAGVLSELASQPGQSIAGRMPQSDAIALGDLSISGPAFARLAEGFIQDAFKIAVDTKSISDDDLPAARGVKESAMAALRSWSGSLAFSILPAEQGGAFILALGGNLGRTIGEFIDAMERAEPIKGEVRWRSFKGVKVQSLAETAGKNQGLVTFEIAHLPDLSILSFGTSIQWATDAAIDSSRSRGGLPRDLADIRASFTEKPLGTMSLKLMKLAAAVEKEEGSETSAQLAEQLAMTDVPILGALFIKKDRVSEQLFISVTTMRNLQAFIMTKMQGTK